LGHSKQKSTTRNEPVLEDVNRTSCKTSYTSRKCCVYILHF